MASEITIVPVINDEEQTEEAITLSVGDATDIEVNTYVDGVLLKDNYLLPDKVYDVLKWVAALGLPAAATFVTALGNIWGIPNAAQISDTLVAIGTLIGTMIGISAIKNYLS